MNYTGAKRYDGCYMIYPHGQLDLGTVHAYPLLHLGMWRESGPIVRIELSGNWRLTGGRGLSRNLSVQSHYFVLQSICPLPWVKNQV